MGSEGLTTPPEPRGTCVHERETKAGTHEGARRPGPGLVCTNLWQVQRQRPGDGKTLEDVCVTVW